MPRTTGPLAAQDAAAKDGGGAGAAAAAANAAAATARASAAHAAAAAAAASLALGMDPAVGSASEPSQPTQTPSTQQAQQEQLRQRQEQYQAAYQQLLPPQWQQAQRQGSTQCADAAAGAGGAPRWQASRGGRHPAGAGMIAGARSVPHGVVLDGDVDESSDGDGGFQLCETVYRSQWHQLVPRGFSVKDYTEIEASAEELPKMTLFDFAGQHTYYQMHHIFITPKLAMYVAVIDLSKLPASSSEAEMVGDAESELT